MASVIFLLSNSNYYFENVSFEISVNMNNQHPRNSWIRFLTNVNNFKRGPLWKREIRLAQVNRRCWPPVYTNIIPVVRTPRIASGNIPARTRRELRRDFGASRATIISLGAHERNTREIMIPKKRLPQFYIIPIIIVLCKSWTALQRTCVHSAGRSNFFSCKRLRIAVFGYSVRLWRRWSQ